jgi:hypothetical protein
VQKRLSAWQSVNKNRLSILPELRAKGSLHVVWATRYDAMHVGMATFFPNIGHLISDHDINRHEISMADLAESLSLDSIWDFH